MDRDALSCGLGGASGRPSAVGVSDPVAPVAGPWEGRALAGMALQGREARGEGLWRVVSCASDCLRRGRHWRARGGIGQCVPYAPLAGA